MLENVVPALGFSQMHLILKINGIFSGLEERDAVGTANLMRFPCSPCMAVSPPSSHIQI